MSSDYIAPDNARAESRTRFGFACGLVIAIWLAYGRSLSTPFFFDDVRSILENPSIRHLGDLGTVLSPPRNSSSVNSRPIINLSFAINYAIGGTDGRGYHAANLAIHSAAALLLFGLIRRTLAASRFLSPPASGAAFGIAAIAAAHWGLHPLQTESVTCVVQRTEVLVGFFFLLTLYGVVRTADTPNQRRWPILAALSCFFGMGTKEVMVSAPLLALLLDRTLLAGSFRAAWRARRPLYIALAATWILLGYLVATSGVSRGSAAGFGLGMPWFHYALKQCAAIAHYAWLALWPHPLVVDYGTDVVTRLRDVWPQALALGAALATTAVAIARRRPASFLGAWFFFILAPSSSFVPLVTQTMAEHRMYLPLAPISVGIAFVVHAMAGRRALLVGALGLVALGALTARRNLDYRSEVAIWTDTVAKRPNNPRAFLSLGNAELAAGHGAARALPHYQRALQLDPLNADAHLNVGSVLRTVPGNEAEVIARFETALRLRPAFPEAHIDLGTLLLAIPERRDEAIAHFEAGLRLQADYIPVRYFADAHFGLGVAFSADPARLNEAMRHYEAALRLNPNLPEAHFNLANALASQPGRVPEAIAHYEAALRLAPGLTAAHYNLGNVWLQQADGGEKAVACYDHVLRLQPGHRDARYNRAVAALQMGRADAAARDFLLLVNEAPGDGELRLALGAALARAGQANEARHQWQEVLRLIPGHPGAREALRQIEAGAVR